MSERTLRTNLIRLAHSNPEMRPHLLPLLKKAQRLHPRMVDRLTLDQAEDMVQDLMERLGDTLKSELDRYRADAYEARQNAEELERAWDRWDWDTLVGFGVLTEDEADFVREVRGRWTPV